MTHLQVLRSNNLTERKKMSIIQDSISFAVDIENCNKLTVASDRTLIKGYLFNAKIVAFINYCKSSTFGIIIISKTGNSENCINYDKQRNITDKRYKNDNKSIFSLVERMFKLSLICPWHQVPDVSCVHPIHHFLYIGNKHLSHGGC